MSFNFSNQAFSSTQQQAPCNVSSERFTSYNEPENFKSLDEAKDLFRDFVKYPPTLEAALEAADIQKKILVLEDSRRLGNKPESRKRSVQPSSQMMRHSQ